MDTDCRQNLHNAPIIVKSSNIFCTLSQHKQDRSQTASTRYIHLTPLLLFPLPLTISWSPILKIFSKSVATVCAWLPRRLSEQMPTQFFPVMARMAAPLYSKID